MSLVRDNNVVIKVAVFWAGFFALLFGYRLLVGLFGLSTSYFNMGVVLSMATLLITFLLLRNDKKTLGNIRLTWSGGTLKRLVLGSSAGVVLMGLILSILVTLSPLDILPVSSPDYFGALVWSGLVFMALSLMEEVAFRAYPLVQIKRLWGTRPAIYITSVVFAFYHGLHLGNLLGPGVWGLYFGLAAVKTNGLAWPVGFHFGLNWVQGLFGLKPDHVNSVWTVIPADAEGLMATDTLSLGLQFLMLILGVFLIEWYLKSASGITSKS